MFLSFVRMGIYLHGYSALKVWVFLSYVRMGIYLHGYSALKVFLKITNLVPRAFSSFKMAVGETPAQGCQNGSKNSLEFCRVNTLKCLRFVWTTVSDCKKTNRAARRWKQPPKKPFHHVSRDKMLHDSLSISAALARDFSDRHFDRGEGPGDGVGR